MKFYKKILKNIENLQNNTASRDVKMLLPRSIPIESINKRLSTIKTATHINAENIVDYIDSVDYTELRENMLSNHVIAPSYDNIFIEFGDKIFKTYVDINKNESDLKEASNKMNFVFATQLIYHKIVGIDHDLTYMQLVDKYKLKWLLEFRIFSQIKICDLHSNIFITTKYLLISETGKAITTMHKKTESQKDELRKDMDILNEAMNRYNLPPIHVPISDASDNCNDSDKARFLQSFKTLIFDDNDELVCFVNYLSWMALTLMHCKNIEIVKAPDGLSNRQRKKMLREDTYVDSHIIQITPMKKTKQYVNVEEKNQTFSITPGRICKGHFKNFTEGKGLFGKYHGLYWWSDQGVDENLKLIYNIKI